jgi:AcrR family transcriptional regulator
MSRAPADLLQTYRRDQILNAAREVIGQHGYEGSSVDQIARRAGLSRSTVYEYFSSKAEILTGCFAARREGIARELADRIDGARGLAAELTAFFEICLARVDENRDFFLAIAFPLPTDEVAAAEGPGGTAFARLVKDFDEALDRILARGLERGELARPVGPDPRACLGILVAGAMSTRGRQDEPAPVSESATRLASFALNGLGAAECT